MNFLLFGSVGTALVVMGLLRGGTQMVFALPCYGLLALAACLSFFRSRRGGISPDSRWCLAAAAVFFGYVLFRTMGSPEEYLARTNLFLAGGALILYLLSAFQVAPGQSRLLLVALLVALGAANCVVGAVQFFEGQNYMPFGLLPRAADYGNRASGFFYCPNHLAGFLEIALLMGLAVAWWSRWPAYAKVLCGFGSLTCLAGLLLTVSRGGYLGTLAGLIVLGTASVVIVIRRAGERRWILLAVLVCFAAVLGWGVRKAFASSYLIENRASSMVGENGNIRKLLGVRRELGNAALKQFLLSPVLGTGSSTYLYYGRQFRAPNIQADPVYAHNDYLQFLAEYGIAGMVGFIFFLQMHIRRGLGFAADLIARSLQTGETQSNSLALTIGALSCVAAYLVHSILDFNLHIPANALSMALVFGILANPGGESLAASADTGRGFSGAFRLVLPGLGVWLALVALPKFPAEFFGEKARMLLFTAEYRNSPEVARQVEALARRGLGYDPKNPRLHYDLGEAQVALAELSQEPGERELFYAESIASYEKALEAAPRDRNLMLCLGWSLDELKRFDESESWFQRALELDPKSAEVRWAYGTHLRLQGKLSEAEAQYRVAANLGSRPAEIGLDELQKGSR